MPLEVEQSGTVQIVHVQGSINSANSGRLQEVLRGLIDGGATRIVLDLQELFYICSLGIGVIAKTRSELDQRQGMLVIQSPREDVRKLLSMLRLDRLIPIADSLEEAKEICG